MRGKRGVIDREKAAEIVLRDADALAVSKRPQTAGDGREHRMKVRGTIWEIEERLAEVPGASCAR